MRKNYSSRIPLLISALLLLTSQQVTAQNDISIQFQGFSSEGKIMKLNYSIPYGGVVETQLFDDSGELVYLDRTVREEGDHHLAIRRSGFKPGQSYSFWLKYKFSEISGEVPL